MKSKILLIINIFLLTGCATPEIEYIEEKIDFNYEKKSVSKIDLDDFEYEIIEENGEYYFIFHLDEYKKAANRESKLKKVIKEYSEIKKYYEDILDNLSDSKK